jgi:histidinol-phosphate aminotransferase
MLPEPRQFVGSVPPAAHGALDFGELRRLGLRPEEVLDFSSNVNPYGPSPAVRTALARVPLDRYPDRESLALRAALTETLGLPSERIVVANGGSELIWLVALAFLRPGDPVLVVGPTYTEYARAAGLMGARLTLTPARAEHGFSPDIDRVCRDLRRLRPRVLFLCNPNNPTGALLHPETIGDWSARHPGTLFVADEAYLPFAPSLPSAVGLASGNVIVLRSMTKDFGLAGLRLGYAIAPEPLAEILRRAQPPWSVNALAQAAGVAALNDLAHRDRTLQLVRRDKGALVESLERLGFCPVPSEVHYFLVRVHDGAAFRRDLLPRGILVRDCASFGLPEYVRIATRRPEENERLLDTLIRTGLGGRGQGLSPPETRRSP